MDIEDIAEVGFLFGGFELLESIVSVVLALVVLAILVGAVLLLDLGIVDWLVVAVLMIGSGVVGTLVGMKVERLRKQAF